MQGGKGLIARTAAIIALVGSTTAAVPAQAQLSKGNGDLRVMTYNVDEGHRLQRGCSGADLDGVPPRCRRDYYPGAGDRPSEPDAGSCAAADACQPPGTGSVVHRPIRSDDADVWSSNDRVRYGAGADERAGGRGCCLHDRL